MNNRGFLIIVVSKTKLIIHVSLLDFIKSITFFFQSSDISS